MGTGTTSDIGRLAQAIDELARIVTEKIEPKEKLRLLCLQIGTAQFWLDQLQSSHEPSLSERRSENDGPHWNASMPVANGAMRSLHESD